MLREARSTSDQVTITAQAAQLQAENATISASIGSRMVEDLPPVVGGAQRSVFNLSAITPEVSDDPSSRNNMRVGGGPRGNMGATLDGVSVMATGSTNLQWADMSTPSIEAIAEFNVETHGFKAEFGRATGGKIIFVSKSGTNQLHGTAYEFVRNQAFDARDFFASTKNIYRQNNFGFSVGGPVYIPKLYDGRNRTFFCSTMEWFRNRVGAASTYFSVPTPEMYQGDFSNWVDANGRKLTIYDPTTTRLGPDGKT